MRIVSSLMFGVACVLAGCASGPPSTALAPQVDDHGADLQKVASIDRAARGRGVDVHWINFPQRRSSAPQGAPVSPAPDLSTGT